MVKKENDNEKQKIINKIHEKKTEEMLRSLDIIEEILNSTFEIVHGDYSADILLGCIRACRS